MFHIKTKFQFSKVTQALKNRSKIWTVGSVGNIIFLKNNNVQQSSDTTISSRGGNELDDEVMNVWKDNLTKTNAARKAMWKFVSAEK